MSRWKKGQSGNPKGRPKGSRDKINKAFVDDFTDDWRKHGKEAIERVREERPAEYLRIAASLVPKEAVEFWRASVASRGKQRGPRTGPARLPDGGPGQADED